MIKKSFTQVGFFYFLEKIVRSNIYFYVIFRQLAKFFRIFENDFKYLKFYFKNKKIYIIDVGASDGISVIFFLKIEKDLQNIKFFYFLYFYRVLLFLSS